MSANIDQLLEEIDHKINLHLEHFKNERGEHMLAHLDLIVKLLKYKADLFASCGLPKP